MEKEQFLDDVKDHQLQILQDNGVYRHIRMAQPGCVDKSYHLITAPGVLIYRGDMGTFVFERLNDMFEFFRQPELKVNLGYWAEKLTAGEAKKFSMELFSELVFDAAKEFVQSGEIDESEVEFFNREIDSLVCLESANGYFAHAAIRDFYFETKKINGDDVKCSDVFGSDTWEWNFDDYTFHFQWCCYAIVFAISEYDKLKERSS